MLIVGDIGATTTRLAFVLGSGYSRIGADEGRLIGRR